MSTVLRVDGQRFFFYSNESNEPPHIHVQKGEKYAKFWLVPVRVAESIDFTSRELRVVHSLITQHLDQLREAWEEYHAQ
jgi:Domain of unknown function (DUF4160)